MLNFVNKTRNITLRKMVEKKKRKANYTTFLLQLFAQPYLLKPKVFASKTLSKFTL